MLTCSCGYHVKWPQRPLSSVKQMSVCQLGWVAIWVNLITVQLTWIQSDLIAQWLELLVYVQEVLDSILNLVIFSVLTPCWLFTSPWEFCLFIQSIWLVLKHISPYALLAITGHITHVTFGLICMWSVHQVEYIYKPSVLYSYNLSLFPLTFTVVVLRLTYMVSSHPENILLCTKCSSNRLWALRAWQWQSAPLGCDI